MYIGNGDVQHPEDAERLVEGEGNGLRRWWVMIGPRGPPTATESMIFRKWSNNAATAASLRSANRDDRRPVTLWLLPDNSNFKTAGRAGKNEAVRTCWFTHSVTQAASFDTNRVHSARTPQEVVGERGERCLSGKSRPKGNQSP